MILVVNNKKGKYNQVVREIYLGRGRGKFEILGFTDQHHHVAPQTPVHLKPTLDHELLDQDQETTN